MAPWLVAGAIAFALMAVGLWVVIGRSGSSSDPVSSEADRTSTDGSGGGTENAVSAGASTSLAPAMTVSTTTVPTSTVPSDGTAPDLVGHWVIIRTSGYVEAEVRAAAAGLEGGLRVIASDPYRSLKPGTWAAIAGPFDWPDEAIRYCDSRGLADHSDCTAVLLDQSDAPIGRNPAFCMSERAMPDGAGGWRRWTPPREHCT